jgi:hypothetical protein
MAYFRRAAVAHYMSPKDDDNLPEFLSFRWSGLFWLLVMVSLIAVGLIWSRPTPVVTTGVGLVQAQGDGSSQPGAVLTVLLPIGDGVLQDGQDLSCDSGGMVLSATLGAVEAETTSLLEARHRFALGPLSELPADALLTIARATVKARSARDLEALLARGGCQVRASVGARPLYSLLPLGSG